MNAETARNKRIRHALLRILKSEYPGAIDTQALKFALDNLGYPMPSRGLGAHLAYLSEGGYVRLDVKRGYGFNIEFAYLTKEGWDLLDGHIGERGVDAQ